MARVRYAMAENLMNMLQIYWPALFAVATMLPLFVVEAATAGQFPPPLDLSGAQAKRVITSPWYLATALPTAAGLAWLHRLARRNGLAAREHASMVWWLVNAVWFHVGCDLLSGFFQVMPVLTELYAHMSPAHRQPRWHEARAHLDSGYALELLVEVPLAWWVLYLFATRDPARHIAEVFAAAIQFAGTVTYYAPGLAKGESHCWLSYMDRASGSVWLVFPLLLLWRHLQDARRPLAKSAKAA